MTGGGSGRWNDETQGWEDGAPPPVHLYGPDAAAPRLRADTDRRRVTRRLRTIRLSRPTRAGRRHSTALIAGAAVAVITIGVGGGWLLWGRDGDPPADARPQGTQASAPEGAGATSGASDPPSSGSPTPEGSPSGTEVPDGYRLVHDRADFTTVVPRGWKRSEDEHGVFYTAPDDRGLVQIFEITGGAIRARGVGEGVTQQVGRTRIRGDQPRTAR